MKAFSLAMILFLGLSGVSYSQVCNTDSTVATTPSDRFTNNGDGTIEDHLTGLMWKRCSEGTTFDITIDSCVGTAQVYDWQSALQQVGVANTAVSLRYSDWRLPNVKELKSIVEFQCSQPAMNVDYFWYSPEVGGDIYWTSTPSAETATEALLTDFTYGDTRTMNKGFGNGVRLVRGGN